MPKKKLAILLIILLTIAAAAAFYFLYFLRTPAYALNQARIALKEHDAEKFQRYVDVHSVMDNAFEDIIKAESKINNDNLLANPFALSILHLLKPSVVNLLQEEALEKIAGKKEASAKPADPVPDAMKRNLERNIPLDKLRVKDLQLVKHAQGRATASLVLHEQRLERDFLAELVLEYDEENKWRIVKINNLSDLIIQLRAAQKAKQAADNKPIMERLNKAVSASPVQLEISAEKQKADADIKDAEEEKLLVASASLKNLTNVSINRMYYDICIMDASEQILYSYPEHFRGSIAPQQSASLRTAKKLYPLLPDDKRLLGQDLQKLHAKIQVTYLAFDDGSVLSPHNFIE